MRWNPGTATVCGVRWTERHDDHARALDAGIVVVLFIALLVDAVVCPEGKGINAPGVGAAVLATVPLFWRRVHPMAVLFVVVLGIFALAPTMKPIDVMPFPLVLALYSVARHGNRRRATLTALASLPFPAIGMLLYGGSVAGTKYLLYLVVIIASVVVGDAVRTKHDYRDTVDAERAAEGDRRVAEERVRIARDVHDVVAHAMVAINVQAGVAAHVLERRPEQAATALQEIKRVSGEALADLRATLGVLREGESQAPVSPTDSLAQLAELAGPLRAAGISVDVNVDGGRVPAAVGAAAYRIVQEALTNVLRHAGAQHADVRVAVNDANVEVEVADDGAAAPVPAAPAGSGNGLRGMAERAAAVGGVVDAGRADDGGWCVRAVLPL